MIIIGVAAFVGALLLYTDRVKAYSLAPIGLSAGIIVLLVLKGKSAGAASVAAGYIIGGILQLGILVAVLLSGRYRKSHNMSWGIRHGIEAPEAKSMARQSVWVLMQSEVGGGLAGQV